MTGHGDCADPSAFIDVAPYIDNTPISFTIPAPSQGAVVDSIRLVLNVFVVVGWLWSWYFCCSVYSCLWFNALTFSSFLSPFLPLSPPPSPPLLYFQHPPL